MNTIIERIKQAYHLETDAEVADFLDIKPSTLSMQKNRGRLNLKRIIAKCSDLNKNWLLHGDGDKWRVNEAKQNLAIPVFKSLKVDNGKPNFAKSNQIGRIVADIQDHKSKVGFSKDVIGYVTTENDMAPTLQSEDVAIIDLQKQPQHNTIFLIVANQRVMLRRLIKNEHNYLAKCENDNHKEVTISEDNNNKCIGKLTGILRSL